MDPLNKAIKTAGGVSKLAASIGVAQNVVSNWRARAQVPANRCADIERATYGAVTRHDLRPDVFSPAPEPPATGATPIIAEARSQDLARAG